MAERDQSNNGKVHHLNGDGAIDERDRVQLPATTVVTDAHAAGLFVHAFTLRSEAKRPVSDYRGCGSRIQKVFEMGVDGVFSDFPDTALAARRR